jgi:hypothetical protein
VPSEHRQVGLTGLTSKRGCACIYREDASSPAAMAGAARGRIIRHSGAAESAEHIAKVQELSSTLRLKRTKLLALSNIEHPELRLTQPEVSPRNLNKSPRIRSLTCLASAFAVGCFQ